MWCISIASVVNQDIAVSAEGLGFDSRAIFTTLTRTNYSIFLVILFDILKWCFVTFSKLGLVTGG